MPDVELLVGPTGSGKTARLVEHVRSLIHGGERPDRILVLVSGASALEAWRERLGAPPPALHTFYGFLTAELRLYWPWLQAAATDPTAEADRVSQSGRPGAASGNPAALAPFVVDPDVTAHLLRALLAQRRAEGGLSQVRATDRRLAYLLDGLHWAASGSGLEPGEAAGRLLEAGAADPAALTHAVTLLEAYRQTLDAACAVDLPLAVHRYTRRLFPCGAYRASLRQRFRHVVADDLHELPPALYGVVGALAGEMASARLAAATDGGRAGRTWDPAPFLHDAVPGLAVAPLAAGEPAPAPSFRYIRSEFRADMLQAAARAVAGLVEGGMSPEEIAVLSPWPDGALRQALASALAVPVRDLGPAPLAAQPCVRALLALVALARPGAIRGAAHDLIRDGLGWLLQLDPVRASILASAVSRAGPLAEPEPSLLQRVGFAAGERWERVRAWLREPVPGGADQFLASAVTRVIAPLVRDPASLAPCTRAVELAQQLRRILAPEPPPGEAPAPAPARDGLLERVLDTIAHGRWDPPPAGRLTGPGGEPRGEGGLLLTTPWRFLSLGRDVRVQVWIDAGAASWLPSGTSVLANPHVLGPRWPAGARWTDAREHAVRNECAARLIGALLRRCRETVLVAFSALDDAGHETQGGLLSFLKGGAGA